MVTGGLGYGAVGNVGGEDYMRVFFEALEEGFLFGGFDVYDIYQNNLAFFAGIVAAFEDGVAGQIGSSNLQLFEDGCSQSCFGVVEGEFDFVEAKHVFAGGGSEMATALAIEGTYNITQFRFITNNELSNICGLVTRYIDLLT